MPEPSTILLVDDDRDVVSGLRSVLESKGYRVLTAHDGNSGLALAETSQPALVIVDMMMPHKSGFLVLETLKRRGGAGPKIIMITANEGARHRAGVWNGEPVTAEQSVSFTVFLACPPPAPQLRTGLCHVLRLSQLDNPLR